MCGRTCLLTLTLRGSLWSRSADCGQSRLEISQGGDPSFLNPLVCALRAFLQLEKNKLRHTGTMAALGEKEDLSGVLKRFLTRISDARQITISTSEGAELMTETRGNNAPHPEDSHTVLSLTPSFCASIDQSSRLQLGAPKHILTWVANSILMQMNVGSLVVSVLLEENANLGIAEESCSELITIIRPFCSFES